MKTLLLSLAAFLPWTLCAETPSTPPAITPDVIQHLRHLPGKRAPYKFAGTVVPLEDITLSAPVRIGDEPALSPTELSHRAISAMVESLRVTAAIVTLDPQYRTICIDHRSFRQGDKLAPGLLPQFDGEVIVETISSDDVVFRISSKDGGHITAKLAYSFLSHSKTHRP